MLDMDVVAVIGGGPAIVAETMDCCPEQANTVTV
jgi:hypothetical protein